MLHKMRPRSSRRAEAQLQTLFDSSLSFSSPAALKDYGKGMTCPVISPGVQVHWAQSDNIIYKTRPILYVA